MRSAAAYLAVMFPILAACSTGPREPQSTGAVAVVRNDTLAIPSFVDENPDPNVVEVRLVAQHTAGT